MGAIGCDVDGVVCDFQAAFHTVFSSIGNKHGMTPVAYPGAGNIPEWNWWKKLNYLVNEEAWKFIADNPKFWRLLEPLHDLAYLSEIYKRQPVIFISRRGGRHSEGNHAYTETIKWFQDYHIDEPVFYRVPSGEEKSEICKKLGIRVMIEDSPTYALELLEAGIEVVLISTEYNKRLQHKNLYRVTALTPALQMAQVLDAAPRI